MIEGIDISGNSGNLDIQSIVQQKAFVYHQATDGVGAVDKMLMLRANEFRAANYGDRLGVYHFLRVRHDAKQDADEQCKEFLDARARAACPLPPWFDVELRSLVKMAQLVLQSSHPDPAIVQIIHDETRAAVEMFWETWDVLNGGTLPFYSSPGEMQMMGLDKIPNVADYPLALAEYVCTPGQLPAHVPDAPKVPSPFTSWMFWQYGGDAPLYGGVVDLVRFNGTLEDLQAL